MTRHPHPSADPPVSTHPPAFTLVELLVVISIIVLVVSMSIPVLSAMQRGSRVAAGVNTVNVAVTAARAYAGQKSLGGDFDDIDGAATASAQSPPFDGVAIIFTPGGNARLVINDATAQDQAANYFESMTGPIRNAYKDIPGREPIRFPNGAGVAGLVRAGGATSFLAPPFAIRFDDSGKLIHRVYVLGGTEDGSVYYDANGNGRYDTDDDRPIGYDPDPWDWRLDPAGSANLLTSLDPPRRQLPFERIESVMGLVAFDLTEFRQAGGWGLSDEEIETWMRSNGTILLFSRQTGTLLRE